MYYGLFSTYTPPAFAIILVVVLNTELNAIKNEVKEGMYSSISFLAAELLPPCLMMFILALFSLVPAFAIFDFNSRHLGAMVLSLALMLWGYDVLAQVQAVSYASSLLGLLIYATLYLMSFLFAGVILVKVRG